MHLIIIRHGKAEPESKTGRDADRVLLPRGVRQAEHLARTLPHEWAVSSIASSDAARARQTAAPIASALNLTPDFDYRLRVDEPLPPVLDLIAAAAAKPGSRGLALVGHNPQLAMLVGLLTLGPSAPALELKTGAAVVLEIDARDAADPAALPGGAVLRGLVRLDD